MSGLGPVLHIPSSPGLLPTLPQKSLPRPALPCPALPTGTASARGHCGGACKRPSRQLYEHELVDYSGFLPNRLKHLKFSVLGRPCSQMSPSLPGLHLSIRFINGSTHYKPNRKEPRFADSTPTDCATEMQNQEARRVDAPSTFRRATVANLLFPSVKPL